MAKQVSVIEKFYIENHMDTLTPEDIALAVGWTEAQVKRYIKYLSKQKGEKVQAEKTPAPVPVPEPQRVVPKTPVGTAFAKKQHGNSSVIAMTQNESEMVDEFQNANKTDNPLKHLESFVHKPFGDDYKK